MSLGLRVREEMHREMEGLVASLDKGELDRPTYLMNLQSAFKEDCAKMKAILGDEDYEALLGFKPEDEPMLPIDPEVFLAEGEDLQH